MRKLKFIIMLTATLGLLGFGWSMPGFARADSQGKCPVLGGKINDKVFTDYQGNRIYFCCAACIDEFKKDPEKYLKKMNEQGVTPAKTP
jgi:YHS domain-containing protein